MANQRATLEKALTLPKMEIRIDETRKEEELKMKTVPNKYLHISL